MTTSEPTRQQLDLDKVFAALEAPLELVDNPERRAELERFVRAARVHQERAIFDLASDLVGAINAAGSTRARLEYEAGKLFLTVQPEGSESDDAADGMFRMDGDMEKVTIRLPGRLKRLIDELAGSRGTSVNTWYIRTLARSLRFQFRDRMEGDRPSRPPHSDHDMPGHMEFHIFGGHAEDGAEDPGRHRSGRSEFRWQWRGPPDFPHHD